MDAQGFDIKPHEELIYEIRRGHRQIYKALIDSGANINYQNNINETPLTVALYRNDFDAIKELVNAGADINFKNRYGSTILTTAASLGKIEAVTFAWLASRTLAGLSGSSAAVTGADGARVLGGIYLGGL